MSEKNNSLLLNKLDAFIKKYYTNRILRGLLYSVGIIVGAYLFVTVFEGLGRFNSNVRTMLFWGLATTSLSILGYYVVIPLLKLFKMGRTISYEDASIIVGAHFPDVKDKLLNTLQLQEEHGVSGSDSLLAASIDQRMDELSPVPFSSAIDFRENSKYLKYALPPLAVLIILLFAAPSLITDSTDRILRYDEEIVEQAPFDLIIGNEVLSVPERTDFTLKISAEGEVVPEKVYIDLSGNKFKLSNDSRTDFTYEFRNLDATQEFMLVADGFEFGPYTLEVLARPVLVNFDVSLDYPDYTGLSNETLRNAGDLSVPNGTKVSWNFNTQNTTELFLSIADSSMKLRQIGGDAFGVSHIATNSQNYTIAPSNELIGVSDSMQYRLQVTPDRYPVIQVEEERDSVAIKQLFFTGDVQDDYGFRRLTFNYAFVTSEDENRALDEYERIDLPRPQGTADGFFHYWDLSELNLQAGEEITYFFEVWDNDGVNGSKSTRTLNRVYAAPSTEEVREERDQENEEIKDKLEESIDDAKELQDELEELRRELLEKEEVGWQEKQKLEEILDKQKQLKEQVEDIQRQNEEKNERQNQLDQQNESIQEKQEQLQELMNEVMNEELQELYDEIQKLMEELDKEELQEQVEQMDMDAEDLEKELDRALEQFKQLEFEQKMEETIDELKELAEDQKELAEESKDKEADSEELKEKQDELNERFEELKEEMDKLEEMNQDLENPNAMPDTEEEQENIEQEMQESSEQLDKNKKNKASDSQQNAGEQMEQMAQQMEMAMDSGESEQMEEDMDALRALLENIITLSFDQEGLMGDFKVVDKNDPKYVQYGQVQRKLKDDAKMVEDSLYALSMRIMQLAPIVNREIGLVNSHMGDALDEVGERNTPEVTMHQQYVMTSFNNLALLLDEALQQMQNQMSCKKPGQGNCEKPGGNGQPKPSPSAGEMKKMQEQLSKQLEQMKEQMGKSGKDGQGENGKKPMSKELAKMAAQQAAIRQMMEQMGQKLNEDGSGNGNGFKQIAKEMEQIEEDIVNKQIDQQTIERQQDILIRLLKAEESERTRGEEEKRKSRTGDQNLKGEPDNMEEYLRKKEKEIELLRTVPPSLKPYYKEKVNDYFNNLDR